MFRYVQIQDGEPLPEVGDLKPFKAIVVVEDRPSPEWQTKASRWLVDSGCLFMLAWGEDCSSWHVSVDLANIEAFDYGHIPDDDFVMTTDHENEPLREVFWLAKAVAEPDNVLILHIGADDKHAKFKKLFDDL